MTCAGSTRSTSAICSHRGNGGSVDSVSKELTDDDGTRWVYDPVANTYQPISPEGDASVPMPAIVFASVYPELYQQFWPDLP